MIVIKNLRFIKSANNLFAYDGILHKGRAYYVTFCHGDIDGELSIKSGKDIFCVSPSDIKEKINEIFKCYIRQDDILFINPCYPVQVRNRYGEALKQNKVFLYSGNWDEETTCAFTNKYKKSGYYSVDKRRTSIVSLLVGAKSEFPWDFAEINKLILNIYNNKIKV